MMVVTLTEFHSMASLHARMAAFVELALWQQPEPSSTSATFAMPLLVEPLSMRLRTSDVRCRCTCRDMYNGPTFSAGASSTVSSMWRSQRCEARQRSGAGSSAGRAGEMFGGLIAIAVNTKREEPLALGKPGALIFNPRTTELSLVGARVVYSFYRSG